MSSGLRFLFASAGRHAGGWVAAAKAWQWGPLVGRVLLAGLGLLLLGAIGRSALAKNLLATEPGSTLDAGPSSAPTKMMALTPAPPPAPASAAPAPLPAATPEVATSAPAPTAARGHATPDDPVYLNQATLADLHRLPGVGPKRAEAVLALRTKLGHFRQIEDLLKVKGIGRASLKKLRPLVRLDPPPAVSVSSVQGDAGR